MKKRKSKKELLEETRVARNSKKAEIEKEYEGLFKYIETNSLEEIFDLEPLEEFTQKKLIEWEGQQPLIVTGKYKDYSKVASTYQQKFVEHIRQLAPGVFEELVPLVPEFERLFGDKKDIYHNIFNSYSLNLLDAYFSFRDSINNSIIKDPHLTYYPNVGNDFDHSFSWGEHKTLLYVLHAKAIGATADDEIGGLITGLVKENLVIELLNLKIPDNFDRSVLIDFIDRIANKVTIALCDQREKRHFEYIVERRFEPFMKELNISPEEGIPSFLKLQTSLLHWAQRNSLTKDWLLRYAYYFISSFSERPDASIARDQCSSIK